MVGCSIPQPSRDCTGGRSGTCDESRPFSPDAQTPFNRMVRDGTIDRDTIIRGPTTNGFWLPAGRVPGRPAAGGRHGCGGMVGVDSDCGRCGITLFEHNMVASEGDGESIERLGGGTDQARSTGTSRDCSSWSAFRLRLAIIAALLIGLAWLVGLWSHRP